MSFREMPSTVLRQHVGPNRGWCADILFVGLGTTTKIFQVYMIMYLSFLRCKESLVCASNLGYLPVAAYV